jgi:FixJ family two-component response regulator
MAIEQNLSLVAILDDDEPLRDALVDLVESVGLPAICFGSAEEFLDSRTGREASCLIADIRMPGVSGLELQAILKSESWLVPIIFITGLGDIPMAVRAMMEGAIDFLTKPVDDSALLKSIERALQRYSDNRREAIEQERFDARYKTLTPREREVLSLLVRGMLNKQVGFHLGITEYTVQIHRAHIMRKMEADSFAALVRLAAKFTVDRPRSVRTVEIETPEDITGCCRNKRARAGDTGNKGYTARGALGSGPRPHRSV